MVERLVFAALCTGVRRAPSDATSRDAADGRVLKLLNVVDEFTREALAIHVARRIDSDQTIQCSNPSPTPAARPLRQRPGTDRARKDWCRFRHVGTAFIEPGSPWQNAYVESFNGRLRDELLDVEQFSCLTEAVVVIEDWRQDYNAHRPHSALGNQAPSAFASGWRVRTTEPATQSAISS